MRKLRLAITAVEPVVHSRMVAYVLWPLQKRGGLIYWRHGRAPFILDARTPMHSYGIQGQLGMHSPTIVITVRRHKVHWDQTALVTWRMGHGADHFVAPPGDPGRDPGQLVADTRPGQRLSGSSYTQLRSPPWL